jgi:hypothetical protein
MLVVAMAFSWISVGSLIMFHKEHVLRQHVDLQAYLFIAPKSKDKPSFSIKKSSPVPGFSRIDFHFLALTGPDGCHCRPGYTAILSPVVPQSTCPKAHLGSSALRAPPQA